MEFLTGIMSATLLAATFTRPMERVATMDPAASRSAYDARAIQLVYEPILETDYLARPYRLVPGFCELPEVSEDGRTYRFRVNRAKDANGLGAADAVRSLERLRDPASPNGWIMKEVESVAAEGDAIVVRLKRRLHYFPWLMAMTATGVRGEDGRGSGPYRLDYWRKNHEMRFVRRQPTASQQRTTNNEQPTTNNYFNIIRYLVVDDASTQWLMFLRGELDLLGEISRDNWDAAVGADGKLVPELAAKGLRLASTPTMETHYLGINMRDPVLGGNRKLRQALNAAFDYPAWERFFNGRTVRGDGPVPPGVPGRLETKFQYAYDEALAKRLLAEAGYPDGIDPKTGRRLELTLAIGRATQDSRESGELLASFYARVGINLKLSFMTWDAFLKAVNDGRAQMFRLGWVGDYPDAQNFLQLFHSASASPGPNHGCYANAEYDRAYEAALAAETVEGREAAWRRCQEIVREDCPWVFLNFGVLHALVSPRVENYVPGNFPYGEEQHYRVGDK